MVKKMFGFVDTLVDVTIGGETIKMIGSSGMPFSSATQSMVALGIFGNAASKVKNLFK